MLSFLDKYSQLFDRLVSPKRVRFVELIILRLALLAFVIHLGIIFLANNILYLKDVSSLKCDPQYRAQAVSLKPPSKTNLELTKLTKRLNKSAKN